MKKSRKNKRHKSKRSSRKYKGGSENNDNSGYVLIGFMTPKTDLGNIPPNSHNIPILDYYDKPQEPGKHHPMFISRPLYRKPIFYLKDKRLKNTETLINLSRPYTYDAPAVLIYFISKLYDLNFRGIDLFTTYSLSSYLDRSKKAYILLFDDTKFIYSNQTTKDDLAPFILENIREVELKYPGLFTRMFITEEEEQDALARIQQKEQKEQEKEQMISEMTAEIERIYTEM